MNSPPPFFLTRQRSSREMMARARELRRHMTHAERVFWAQVRNSATEEGRFRRQVVIADYIVDFYCPKLRLVVEIDGSAHRDHKGQDEQRDQVMLKLGLQVIRLTNDEVLAAPSHALARVLQRARAYLAAQRAQHAMSESME